MTKALRYMVSLINGGMDFPAAQWETCCKFDLTDVQADILIERYDKEY